MRMLTRPLEGVSRGRNLWFAGYAWLILKNILGWALMLAALVAGPLVPGPGGLPLFLIGFALISFPGKRKLTARVLRGKQLDPPKRCFSLVLPGLALLLAVLALFGLQHWYDWPTQRAASPWRVISAFLLAAVGAAWLMTNALFRLTNLLLRNVPRIRRRMRPWLRRHHIRLLPPRWRRRLPHEQGVGPHRLKDEILKLGRHA